MSNQTSSWCNCAAEAKDVGVVEVPIILYTHTIAWMTEGILSHSVASRIQKGGVIDGGHWELQDRLVVCVCGCVWGVRKQHNCRGYRQFGVLYE